jgi:hypothetical protein
MLDALMQLVGLRRAKPAASYKVDIILMLIGGIWLFGSPETLPALLTVMVQTIALVINVVVLMQMPQSSLTHQALVVHIFLRLVVIGGLFQGVGELGSIDGAEA